MNNKKKIMIVVCIFLICFLLAVIAILFNQRRNYNNNIVDNGVSDIYQIKNVNDYLNIKNVIDNYYKYICNYDNTSVMLLLDDNYIKNNNINELNAYDYSNFNYYSIEYVPEKIYVKEKEDIRYYFLEGTSFSYDIGDSPVVINHDIKFLVKINNNNYTITPILKSTDLENYAGNMLITKINKSNRLNVLKKQTYSDKWLYNIYINYFVQHLMLETDKAYDLLSSSYKKNFSSSENLYKDRFYVYNKINSKIVSFSKKYNNVTGETVHTLKLSSCDVNIYEKSIMDFKIEIQ